MTKLLERDPEKRIGFKEGACEIINHPFFKNIDWDELKQKLIKPPFKPKILGETSVKYFSQEFVNEEAQDSFVNSQLTLMQKSENHFEQFTYGKEVCILAKDIDEHNKSRSMANSVIWEIDADKEDHSEI